MLAELFKLDEQCQKVYMIRSHKLKMGVIHLEVSCHYPILDRGTLHETGEKKWSVVLT